MTVADAILELWQQLDNEGLLALECIDLHIVFWLPEKEKPALTVIEGGAEKGETDELRDSSKGINKGRLRLV